MQVVILFYLGCPGAGKTTAIKHIVQEYRNDGNDIYYINMNSKGIEGVGGRAEDLKYLLKGIRSKYNSARTPHRSVTLIVDDIHLLEKLKTGLDPKFEEFNHLFNIYTSTDLPFLQIICIASSSKFTKKIMKDNYYSVMQKAGHYVILQD